MARLTPARLGLSEGRVHVPAPGTPQYKRSAPTPRAAPQPQRHEERPLGHTPGSGCVTPIGVPCSPGAHPCTCPGATHSLRTQDSRRRRCRLALRRGPLPSLPLQGRAPGARGCLGHGEDRAGQGLQDARAPGGRGLMGTGVAPPSAREEETKASLARPHRPPSRRFT